MNSIFTAGIINCYFVMLVPEDALKISLGYHHL
jgi:hypothetical protein